ERVGMHEVDDRTTDHLFGVARPDTLEPRSVHVYDPAALVHDDAVGAQVDEPAVTVDQTAKVRLDEMAVADVDDDAGAADDLAVLADLPGAHEEVLLFAGPALEALLQFVVTPGCAALKGRDDRRHQPVGDIGSGHLGTVGCRDPD